jgi:uncharacterized Tic20 family protein
MNVSKANQPQATDTPATDQPAETQAQPTVNPSDEKIWATVAHAGTLAGCIVPFGNIIVPLAVYLIKKEESAFIGEHAKESLNFQISLTIYSIGAWVLTFLLIGFLLFPVLIIFWLVFVIKASLAAHKGDSFRYPYILHLVK